MRNKTLYQKQIRYFGAVVHVHRFRTFLATFITTIIIIITDGIFDRFYNCIGYTFYELFNEAPHPPPQKPKFKKKSLVQITYDNHLKLKTLRMNY